MDLRGHDAVDDAHNVKCAIGPRSALAIRCRNLARAHATLPLLMAVSASVALQEFDGPIVQTSWASLAVHPYQAWIAGIDRGCNIMASNLRRKSSHFASALGKATSTTNPTDNELGRFLWSNAMVTRNPTTHVLEPLNLATCAHRQP